MENIDNKTMYRDYNISEWKEKCYILSDDEIKEVMEGITNGIDSELIDNVKLPFPKFVENYFSKYDGAKKALSDPSFGYRLYLLKEIQIRYMSERIKNPNKKSRDFDLRTTTRINIQELREMLKVPYEDLVKLRQSENSNIELEKKYIYISQYIDKEAAEKMQLKSFTFLDQGEYRGFDLEGKLNSLNPVVRLIMCKYIGLYGEEKKSIQEISRELRLSLDKVNKLLGTNGYVFNGLLKSTQTLRNKIGYIDKNYEIDEYREYQSGIYDENYRNLDMALEVQYIIKNLLSDSEREVLNGLSNSKQEMYIFEKKIKPHYHKDRNVKNIK